MSLIYNQTTIGTPDYSNMFSSGSPQKSAAVEWPVLKPASDQFSSFADADSLPSEQDAIIALLASAKSLKLGPLFSEKAETSGKRPDVSKAPATWNINKANFNDPDAYLKALYKNVLGRDADAAGLQHWTGIMNNGVSQGEVFEAFINSPEFQKKYPDVTAEDKVKLAYRQMLGKNPSAREIAEVKGKSVKELINHLKNQKADAFIKTLPQQEQDRLNAFFNALGSAEGKASWERFKNASVEEKAGLEAYAAAEAQKQRDIEAGFAQMTPEEQVAFVSFLNSVSTAEGQANWNHLIHPPSVRSFGSSGYSSIGHAVGDLFGRHKKAGHNKRAALENVLNGHDGFHKKAIWAIIVGLSQKKKG